MRFPIGRVVGVALLGATLVGCTSARGGMAVAPRDTFVAPPPTTVTPVVTSVVTAPPTEVVVVPVATSTPFVTPSVPAPPTPAPTLAPSPGGDGPGDIDAALVLRADGFGLFSFGAGVNEVLLGSPSALGSPVSDVTLDFPTVDGSAFVNEPNSLVFAFPAGREFCWPDLCMYFGGASTAELRFVGWTYRSGAAFPTIALFTTDGISIGSRWSDFRSAMAADPGGCFSIGSGATNDGIFLVLQGGVFSQIDEAGNYEALLPAPEDVIVLSLDAGEQMLSLEGDC